MIFSAFYNEPWFILICLILIFAFIGVIVFFLRKMLNRKNVDEKPDDKEIAKEELDNILVEVEENKTEDNEE